MMREHVCSYSDLHRTTVKTRQPWAWNFCCSRPQCVPSRRDARGVNTLDAKLSVAQSSRSPADESLSRCSRRRVLVVRVGS